MRDDHRARRGIALLEVLVGLAILGTTGLALVTLIRQAAAAQAAVRQEEMMLRAADRVLTAMTLLGRTDLDRRIGRHPVGEFEVHVSRPERVLYRIAIAAAAAPERTLLATVVHRPEPETR